MEVVGYASTDDFLTQRFERTHWLPPAPRQHIGQRFTQQGVVGNFAEFNFLDQQSRSQEQPLQTIYLPDLPATAAYLYYQLPGWDSLLVSPIRQDLEEEEIQIAPPSYAAARAVDFPAFHWSADGRTITIPAGQHVLTQPLVIGPRQQLLIAPGAQIDLLHHAFILSYGPLQAIGEAEQDIKIFSSDQSGQGLHLIQPQGSSRLRYVAFSDLGTLSQSGWKLSGAVTFYEAAVQIADCVFHHNHCEDALNLIRSSMDIQRCQFLDIAADGLDSDFCKGTIRACRFERTGNDGLDLSGSFITLSECFFDQCHDKGISVGEASEVVVHDSRLANCPIGIAAKDHSTVLGRNLHLHDCRQGVVIFQKKPEYGPAQVLLENLNAHGVDRLYQIGPGSRLQIDDQIFTD
ncbi:MAG: right-handed parallel beta-helix repeat-containing protein [Bacteroidetes bacterium]|nr:MAG: right-handed parallel beta-helix repeat-containing protein [Bacteroidota bacterium]